MCLLWYVLSPAHTNTEHNYVSQAPNPQFAWLSYVENNFLRDMFCTYRQSTISAMDASQGAVICLQYAGTKLSKEGTQSRA